METVTIKLEEVCPYLIERKLHTGTITLDPNRESESDAFCDAGYKTVNAQINPNIDMMLKPENLDISVSYAGCILLPSGFNKQVSR